MKNIKIYQSDKKVIEHKIFKNENDFYYISTIDYRWKTPCLMTSYGHNLNFTKNYMLHSLEDAAIIFKDCKIVFENCAN